VRARPRALLIANPTAKRVTLDRRRAVAERLAGRLDIRPIDTEGPGHAVELARAAAQDGFDLLVVLGGDGTINEIVNGTAEAPVPVGLLPGGGANVLARSLGVSPDLMVAANRLVERLDAEPVRLPLGKVDGRYFASNCGMGLDAEIVRHVERRPGLKHRAGDLYFVWQGLLSFFFRIDRSTPHLEVTWGPSAAERRSGLFLAIVQNTNPYTYFGRHALRLCPDADAAGGLDLFAMDSLRARHAVPVLLSAFRAARRTGNDHVMYLNDQPRVSIRSDVPMPVQADGEYLGERRHVEVEWVPEALSVLH
jgi:diacylglycerol kinase family enzyme